MKKMNSKYPTTSGYYVYMHRTPEKDIYVGMSQLQPSQRFQPSLYKRGSLQPYIEQFGWDNIEHVVLFDGLTKHQAEVLEDWFIKNAQRDGFCINKHRSGGIRRDNPKEYQRYYQREYQDEYHQTEKYKAYQREYQREYRREYQRNRYQNDPEYCEKIKERQRQYRLKKKSLNLS